MYCLLNLLSSLLIVAVHASSVVGQWVKEPTAQQRAATPGLVHETFKSSLMKATVGYSVVLPPDYSTSTKRYPVVYWLHGGGGNECSNLYTAKAWLDQYKSKQIDEVILVYPNGFRSGYMDHHDGKIMVESLIIRELIPRIDQRYRTIASRAGRAVHGFSMGSSGALKFVVKYPDLFSAAVAYGGGAIDLENSKSQFILNILERNLKSDPDLIQENNTYHQLKSQHTVVRQNGVRFLLICGEEDSWKESAVTFRKTLIKLGIECDLKLVPEVGHDLRGLMAAQGTKAALFQDRAFREALSHQEKTFGRVGGAIPLSESYYSAAEGRYQSFQVVLPPGYSRSEKYPLIVQVFGAASLLPSINGPFIRVRPTGRGVWGYRSMSRYDVMQIVDRMKAMYPIDGDRIYMTGTSAGATGMMHVAAQRPDVFAGLVPLVAFGNDLPLENFHNVPIRCEHGINDWTSAIGNVRVQFQKLNAMGYDAKLNEHPTAGHGIRVPPAATMEWLFKQKRDSNPKRIVYSCEHPRDGRAYWVKIDRLTDPHRIARIEATVDSKRVDVKTINIEQFSIERELAHFGTATDLFVDRVRVSSIDDLDGKRLTLKRGDTWQVLAGSEPNPSVRMYGAGAAANLFQGEPLLVIYGTGADAVGNRFLREAATTLARSGGPDFKAANVRFPIRADTDLAGVQLENFNLLLVGTPKTNTYLRRIASAFPYSIADGKLKAPGREEIALTRSILGFHFYNPEHSNRLIYVVSPYLEAADRNQFLSNPRRFLAGSDGFKMIDQPDLLIRGIEGRIRREMQLDDNWKFIQIEGADRRIPNAYTDRMHLAIAHMKAMKKKAKADFALWWGPQDKGLFGGYDFNWLPTFDPRYYTLADYSIRRRETETMTAVLSGEELQDIFDRWITKREIVMWPAIFKDIVKSNRRYRIVIPMDLVPKLGLRRKVLSDVAVGTNLLPDMVVKEVFIPSK